MLIDRRALLAGFCSLGAFSAFPAFGSSFPRIVSLDYGAAATFLSMGVTPVGVQSRDRWNRWVLEPELPNSVANIGQDLVVNLEVIAALRPDLIISTPYTDAIRSQLEPFAPVHKISIYDQSGTPLANAYRETKRLGELAGLEDAAAAFLKLADKQFGDMKKRLAAKPRPPVALVNFMDARHVRVYGKRGLYQDSLDRLGIENAWTRPTNSWGFATVGLEELARHAPPDMHLIVFEPVLEDVKPTLDHSPLWQFLPVVQQDRIKIFPPVLTFGMVPSALRFSRLLTAYLEGLPA